MTHDPAMKDRQKLKDGTAVARFIVVFGPKGGSGKTTVARGIAYALMQGGQPFTVVDSDNENPDLFKEHALWQEGAKAFVKRRDHIDVDFRELKTPTQFIKFGNWLQQNPGTVLLNTAAGSGKDLLPQWQKLFQAAEATGRKLTVLSPVDRGRDTLESLRDFVEAIVDDKRFPNRRIAVLKNLFFGAPDEFARFDAWAANEMPASMMVRSWPSLNEIVVDKLADKRAARWLFAEQR